MNISKPPRKFVAENLVIDAWEKVESYFKTLLEEEWNSKEDFQQWLTKLSELEAVLSEDLAWRYIKMTIDTKDEDLTNDYAFFVHEIQPNLSDWGDRINHKINKSPFLNELKESSQGHFIYFRAIQKAIELYREENSMLEAEISSLSKEYGGISGKQTIEYKGQELTMQQASQHLKDLDEEVRREVFTKTANRRLEDKKNLHELFTTLIDLRNSVAKNAEFDNFRDYKFESMGRYDYTKEDCFAFHESIKEVIVPLVKDLQEKRLKKLNKPKFKPWDQDVDPEGKEALKPFKNGKDLLEKSLKVLKKVDPYFSSCVETMEKMGHLDLESKLGKAPGGYNYPLYEIGVPFIFMNAVGSQRDLITMIHESGHAVHSFLSRDLALTGFKSLPSEVAELASMSMELLSMKYWDEFYSSKDDLKRAKREHLEDILRILCWIAQIDQFQHWIYENPKHKVEERTSYWLSLCKDYGTQFTDWTGFEEVLETSWQRQLHLFEVPFYYIEYGIAQLGALGVWMNSIENEEKAIAQYKDALALGYTKSIPEIYETAGVKFDFSKDNLSRLSKHIQKELQKLD